MGDSREVPRVVVAGVDPYSVNLFGRWLSDKYDVSTATSFERFTEVIDPLVSTVLLDRQLINDIDRNQVWELSCLTENCSVVLVESSPTQFDVIERGFDDCLVKPISPAELVETVERLRTRQTYEAVLEERWHIQDTQRILEQELDGESADASEVSRTLQRKRSELDTEADRLAARLTSEDFNALFRDADSKKHFARPTIE